MSIELNGRDIPDKSMVEYGGRIWVSKDVLASEDRSEVTKVVHHELLCLMRDMETSILADWDELHKEPLEDFAKALTKALADRNRDSKHRRDVT